MRKKDGSALDVHLGEKGRKKKLLLETQRISKGKRGESRHTLAQGGGKKGGEGQRSFLGRSKNITST